MNLKYFLLVSMLAFSYVLDTQAAIPEAPERDAFTTLMVDKHQFDPEVIEQILQNAEIKPQILQAMNKPAEALPWYKYRAIFMTEKRIAAGVKFWQDNNATLTTVSQQTGVPAEIIVAIIGVETHYGINMGNHRVLDALATLGFGYPKRSAFFLSELENFLLLCREEHLDPLLPLGSYAGAMGMPQFMPSSYRNFAVDYEQDNHRDIWKNPADSIASVANYFVKHGWQTQESIFIAASADDLNYKSALNDSLELQLSSSDLSRFGIKSAENLKPDARFKLLALQLEQSDELWLGLHNFYVLTRYNRSPLYAMAVYQLSQAIADRINPRFGDKL